MIRDHAAAIARWITDLATLTAGNAPLADSKAKITALTGMLGEQYPPELFTRKSIEHVARECKFFPSYAELVASLDAYRKTFVTDARRLKHEPPVKASAEPYNPVACTRPQHTVPAYRPHLPVRSPWQQMAELGMTQEQIAALCAPRKPDAEKLKEIPHQQSEHGVDIASAVVPIATIRVPAKAPTA